MEENQGNRSEQGKIEPCGELGEGRSSTNEVVMNECWVRDETWIREPTPETVKRLIEWLSDKRN